MLLLGRVVFIVGLVISLLGIIIGFTLMFTGYDNWAKFCFMVVPLGFLFLFAGLSTTVLLEPRDSEKS